MRLAVLYDAHVHLPAFHALKAWRLAVMASSTSLFQCVSDCRSRGREFESARSHTFVEIDHEIISTVILLPSADSFKKGCCQLQAKVSAQITG